MIRFTGLRTFQAAHACAASHVDLFTAILSAAGVVSLIYGIAMAWAMRRDRLCHERRSAERYGLRSPTIEDSARSVS